MKRSVWVGPCGNSIGFCTRDPSTTQLCELYTKCPYKNTSRTLSFGKIITLESYG
jgi:hypothetical protein